MKMREIVGVLCLVVGGIGLAHANPHGLLGVPVREEARGRPPYVSVAGMGGLIKPTADVDPTYTGSIELRGHLPWLDGAFSLGVEGGYYSLYGDGEAHHSLLDTYPFTYDIRVVPFRGHVVYSLFPRGRLVPFVGGGYTFALVNSHSVVFDGDDYRDATSHGVHAFIGLEYALGPGNLVASLRHSYLPAELVSSTDNVGGGDLSVGYRLLY